MNRVLIVDDNAGFRRLARQLLENGGYEVVGEARDADEALVANDLLRPDVVLLDIQLPDRDGFAVATLLADTAQPPRVVLISSRDRTAYRHRLSAVPTCAFVAKGALSLQAFGQAIGAP
jgi:DNA-binding NarL/FixJ family response regulator